MRILNRLSFLAVVLGIIIGFPAAAAELEHDPDESAIAVILQAEGSNVTVYRNSTRQNIAAGKMADAGLPLFNDDIIQTGADSSVEMQVQPSSGIIRLGSDTSIALLSDSAPIGLTLAYGSLQLKNQDDTLQDPVNIAFGPIAMQAIGADLSLKYELSSSTSQGVLMAASIAVFAGQIHIAPDPFKGDNYYNQNPDVLQLSGGKLLEVGIPDTSQKEAQILRSATIPAAMRTEWEYQQRNDDPQRYPKHVLASPASRPSSTAHIRNPRSVSRAKIDGVPEQRFFTPNATIQRVGLGLFAVGAAAEIMGVTFMLFGDSLLASRVSAQSTRHTISYGLLVSGGVVMGLGIGSFLLGFSY